MMESSRCLIWAVVSLNQLQTYIQQIILQSRTLICFLEPSFLIKLLSKQFIKQFQSHRMEKKGLQEQKENICPKSPHSKPLPFTQKGNGESFMFYSANSIHNQQNMRPRNKERRSTKISILNFLQQKKQGRSQQHLNAQKKEKIFIK